MRIRTISTFAQAALAILLVAGISFTGCTTAQGDGKTLFITGTYGAINRGVYDGSVTVADLKRHGDFALGTFSGIDGELVALNGTYYQIGAQGKINLAEDTWTTPNATVTFFKPDKVITISQPLGYQELQSYLNGQLPTPNIFYAMKVTGKFDSIKARSLTKLTKPYPSTPYSTITQNEPTFDFSNLEGTLVVIVSPAYTGELSYPGYHAHFISSDGKYGGHVIDCRITSGQVEVASLPNFTVNLPQNSEFYKADFTKSYAVSQSAVPAAAVTLAQNVIQAKLDLLDSDMSKAAGRLSSVPLNGPEARQILNELYSQHPGIIDLVATDAAGTMVTFVPDSYKIYEGRFVGGDEKMKNFNRDKEPVLSPMFRTVEGVDALVIIWPVFSDKGEFKGSLSALFRPDQLFSGELEKLAGESGVEFIIMQSDGLILYNSGGAETGKNLFTDPMYQSSADLIALGKTMVAQDSGSGSYTFISHETGKQAKKQAAWVSAGLHGTNWRLSAITESGL
ncbi:MAG: acetolactate decarboxylase [Chloroflexi bacterium]|nr:acetolactate decarboxylase [Chloroflexota bacterium]